MASEYFHKPVLIKEAVSFLMTKENGIYFDGTLGGGGYTTEILRTLSKDGKVIATDLDINSVEFCNKKFNNDNRLIIVNDNFRNIRNILNNLSIYKIDGAILDLGVSSFQFDSPDSGFSYRFDSPFDLRFDKNAGQPASFYLNNLNSKEIERILRVYGEERFASRLTKEIINNRKDKYISSSLDVVDIIKKATPPHKLNETLSRVFQAFRIFVNDELENLRLFLSSVLDFLNPAARLVVVSYHSLEDRIVKDFFNFESLNCICPKDFPVCRCDKRARLVKITKKAIIPSSVEITGNIRSRSAKLRVAEAI